MNISYNEGIRTFKEFTGQAIPEPSLFGGTNGTSKTEHQIRVYSDSFASLANVLIGDENRIKATIDLGGGVSLSPLFQSMPGEGAKDGLDFAVKVPVGLPNRIAAQLLYDWAAANGVPCLHANSSETPIAIEAGKSMTAISAALNHDQA